MLRDNPAQEQRRLAHQVKLVSVSGVYDIVTNAEPFAKLMDLLMVVTLQSYRWIDEDAAERTFGARSQSLIQAMRTLRVDLWGVAGRVLRAEQLQQLDALTHLKSQEPYHVQNLFCSLLSQHERAHQ